MSDSTTIARPYAKAVFEHALAEKKLAEWSQHLDILAQAVSSPQAEYFISSPASSVEQQIQLLEAVCTAKATDNKSLHSFIALLASNKRLMLLPAINALYDAYKAEQEKTLFVDVISFSAMSASQQKKLVESLSKRLHREVSLKINIDPSLLGGALIQAGDLVIDGTIRGKLHKLETELAA